MNTHTNTMSTTNTMKLPADLYPAYEWTASAGELGELASLKGAALDAYCAESAANAVQHEVHDVTASDINDLAAWLRGLVVAHAEAEGRNDYHGRAGDVEAGMHDADWAWPFEGADEAYINAVSPRVIIDEICELTAGTEPFVDGDWTHLADMWCAAFRRGYVAAHAEDAPVTVEPVDATDELIA